MMVFSFGAYALYTHAQGTPVQAAQTVAFTTQDTPVQTPAPAQTQPVARVGDDEDGEYDDDDYVAPAPVQTTPAPAPTPVQTKPAPTPTPTPTPTPAPSGKYRDGTYTGSSVYVYYGYVQVQAIVQGGKLADVKFLQYPNDRSTSRMINSQAMPILKQEAIQAQSAQVDGVSGASDTSQGFVQSLSSALSQA